MYNQDNCQFNENQGRTQDTIYKPPIKKEPIPNELKTISNQLNNINSHLASIDKSMQVQNLIRLWKHELISDELFSKKVRKLIKIKVDIVDNVWED